MIKLLIIEDSEETREFLKLLLSKKNSIQIFESNTLKNGFYNLEKEKPDIVLLDLSLPDGHGSIICKAIKEFPEKYGTPFILALTADTTQESVNESLKMGCDDYIKKPFDTTEFLIRLQKFIDRLPKNNEVIEYENIKLYSNNKAVLFNEEYINLSKNEFELLQYFILNKGLLLSRNIILDNVWSDNLDISDKAVDQCLKRLRKKLPILNEFLISKRGFGYLLK